MKRPLHILSGLSGVRGRVVPVDYDNLGSEQNLNLDNTYIKGKFVSV